MGLLLWIIFGAVVGFIADMFDRSVTLNWLERTIVGVVGAVVGGSIFQLITTGELGLTATNEFGLMSIIVAVVGALISLFVWKRFVRGGAAIR